MAIDIMTGREAIPEDQKQTPGVHPHMRPSPRGQRFQQYPRMLYKGPPDDTGQNRLVNSVEEENVAVLVGWPRHYPLPPDVLPESPPPASVSDEAEKGFFRRGPGRPRKVKE